MASRSHGGGPNSGHPTGPIISHQTRTRGGMGWRCGAVVTWSPCSWVTPVATLAVTAGEGSLPMHCDLIPATRCCERCFVILQLGNAISL